MKKKKPSPVEIVSEGTLFDRTEWAFVDEEPMLKERRIIGKHCAIVCQATRFDQTEDVIHVHLGSGWTKEELLKIFRAYLKKYRPIGLKASK
jgi:hypothetical protein